MQNKELEASANCIKEILESYVEFIGMVISNSEGILNEVAQDRFKDWKPVLDKVNADLKILKTKTRKV